jgi:hypothetical protein
VRKGRVVGSSDRPSEIGLLILDFLAVFVGALVAFLLLSWLAGGLALLPH